HIQHLFWILQVCTMQAEGGVSRRDILSGLAGAAVVAAPAIANAETEYPNVPYLGGSDTVLVRAPCHLA
ncbi:MAG: hypothetical protein ACPIOQ_27640, partial [Promethearchaeia archaeon]